MFVLKPSTGIPALRGEKHTQDNMHLSIRFLRIVFLCSLPQAQWNAGRWDYPVIKLTHCAAFQHFLYLISREGTPSLSHKAVPILLMGLYRISC